MPRRGPFCFSFFSNFFVIANLSFFPIFHKSGSEMLKIVLKRMKMSEISGGLRPLDPHRGLQPLDPACGGSAPYAPAGAAPLDPACGGYRPPHPLTGATAPGPGHPGTCWAGGPAPSLAASDGIRQRFSNLSEKFHEIEKISERSAKNRDRSRTMQFWRMASLQRSAMNGKRDLKLKLRCTKARGYAAGRCISSNATCERATGLTARSN